MLTKRAARHIRRGIMDARARRTPWWSPMGMLIEFVPWYVAGRAEIEHQPRTQAYRNAYEHTAERMPEPLPPRGGSGASR